MEVNILGTTYEIEKLDVKDSCMLKNNADAYVDYTKKKIFLHKDDVMINASLRHELVHAFMYEAGIEFGYQFHNEDVVNYIATIFPKLEEAFKITKCI